MGKLRLLSVLQIALHTLEKLLLKKKLEKGSDSRA
jgi:hypothetical protein